MLKVPCISLAFLRYSELSYMNRTLLRFSVLALPVVWAACSDSPVESPVEREAVTVEAGRVAPAATDAASLQAALDAAAVSGGLVVVSGTITLDDPLTYHSDAPLTILGQDGARIVGPFDPIAAPSNSGARVGEETVGDGLQILGEPDLSIRNVAFTGQTGHGVYYEFSDDATGTVGISLHGVAFSNQGLSGMWVEEQAGGSEGAPDPIESEASIHLQFQNVRVMGTGYAEDEAETCREFAEGLGCSFADFDGVRVNEGGNGDITFAFRNVTITGNAGDGVELDETGAGEVRGTVNASDFSGNGDQPQFPADLEDGFDIDEAGPGGIHLAMHGTTVNGNIDEGVDLDESDVDDSLQDIVIGAGDVYFEARGLVATGNADENIKISDFLEIVQFDEDGEEIDDSAETYGGAGDIILALSNVVADGSAEGRGARFEELGEGDVVGYITNSSFSDNTEDDGLRIDEEDDGSIDVALRNVVTNGNDGQGIQMTENGMGDIILVLNGSESTGNGNTAVELEEEDEGGHDVTIRGSVLIGEPGEESLDVIEADAGTSTVTIRGGTVSPAPVSSGDVVIH
jgi:hypothetical protein